MNHKEHEAALDEGYRDALALLTATDTEDEDARAMVWRNACQYHMGEALLSMLLAMIDDHHDGDVASWVHKMTLEFEP